MSAGRVVPSSALPPGSTVRIRIPRPGWERRRRMRGLLLVVVCALLSLSGSGTWRPEALYRAHRVTRTGAGEWMVVWSAWPTWEERYVLADREDTARILDAALWRLGQGR